MLLPLTFLLVVIRKLVCVTIVVLFAAPIRSLAKEFAMTPLRQRMLEDMEIRNLCLNTQR